MFIKQDNVFMYNRSQYITSFYDQDLEIFTLSVSNQPIIPKSLQDKKDYYTKLKKFIYPNITGIIFTEAANHAALDFVIKEAHRTILANQLNSLKESNASDDK
jgi:hypothetical protein